MWRFNNEPQDIGLSSGITTHPRGHNHVVLTEEDLILMHCIMNRVKVNWIHVMKDHKNKLSIFANDGKCTSHNVASNKITFFPKDLCNIK